MQALSELKSVLCDVPRYGATGIVAALRGPLIIAKIAQAALGDLCKIRRRDGRTLYAKVVGFDEEQVSLAPYDGTEGLTPGTVVENSGANNKVVVPADLRGLVLNSLGSLLHGTPQGPFIEIALNRTAPAPLGRRPIDLMLRTGVRSIDGLCPIGYGQRVGLLAGAGVGKSTLLGMIARNARVDACVIGLVGERGREVNDFLSEALGDDGLKKSTVVVSTSDEMPMRRQMAALTATAIAEHYRDLGKNVLLLIDSITRVARAVRDVTLAAGELPVRQGYTSSVYTFLPSLLERAGTNENGSITAIYTILTNGDGEVDPLAEEVKSILDGHIQLDSRLAAEGIRPALDPLASVSRLLHKLKPPEQRTAIGVVLKMLHRTRRDRDIVLLGGEPDPELKAALELEPKLRALLTQSRLDNSLEDVDGLVAQLAREFQDRELKYEASNN